MSEGPSLDRICLRPCEAETQHDRGNLKLWRLGTVSCRLQSDRGIGLLF